MAARAMGDFFRRCKQAPLCNVCSALFGIHYANRQTSAWPSGRQTHAAPKRACFSAAHLPDILSAAHLCHPQVLKDGHNVVWAAQQAADGVDVDPRRGWGWYRRLEGVDGIPVVNCTAASRLETPVSADTPVIKLPETYRRKGTEQSKQAVCMHAHPAVGCTVRARQRSATRACGQRGCGPAARRRIHA